MPPADCNNRSRKHKNRLPECRVLNKTRRNLKRRATTSLVFFLSSTFLLLSGSAFQATSHDAAHGAFMTLLSYAFPREDEAHHPGRGPQSCRGWAFELGNAHQNNKKDIYHAY